MIEVLAACEESGIVREAFRKLGFDAYSCDTEPSSDNSPYHIQCDVREILDYPWSMILGFPPCTYLTNTAVQYLHTEPGRWEKLADRCITVQ